MSSGQNVAILDTYTNSATVVQDTNVLEPLLSDTPRFTVFPIQYPELYDMLKKQRACFWVPEEIDFSNDIKDWNKLNDDERHFLKHVLAFFAGADGIVCLNILKNFISEISAPEALAVYSFQVAIESVHSESYSLMIETYIKDPAEKERIFNAASTVPCVAKKADWALKWVSDDASQDRIKTFVRRLVAFAIVEGLFFSGAFCAIYWIKQRHILPGLCDSNSFIARDERLHTEFACMLYARVAPRNKLPESEVHQMVREAVAIEKEFIIDSLPCRLIGMNADMMSQYIEYVADRLLVDLGCAKLFETSNPFAFMELIGLESKTNFLDKRSTDYQKAHVLKENDTIAFSDDF